MKIERIFIFLSAKIKYFDQKIWKHRDCLIVDEPKFRINKNNDPKVSLESFSRINLHNQLRVK